MTITNFVINNVGPLEIEFPNKKNVELSITVEWTDIQLDNADLLITYSVEGNQSNVCFDNKSKVLSVEHKAIYKDETIHELLTFSISGNNNPPDDQFELKVKGQIGDEITSEKLITVLIKKP